MDINSNLIDVCDTIDNIDDAYERIMELKKFFEVMDHIRKGLYGILRSGSECINVEDPERVVFEFIEYCLGSRECVSRVASIGDNIGFPEVIVEVTRIIVDTWPKERNYLSLLRFLGRLVNEWGLFVPVKNIDKNVCGSHASLVCLHELSNSLRKEVAPVQRGIAPGMSLADVLEKALVSVFVFGGSDACKRAEYARVYLLASFSSSILEHLDNAINILEQGHYIGEEWLEKALEAAKEYKRIKAAPNQSSECPRNIKDRLNEINRRKIKKIVGEIKKIIKKFSGYDISEWVNLVDLISACIDKERCSKLLLEELWSFKDQNQLARAVVDFVNYLSWFGGNSLQLKPCIAHHI